MTPRERMLEHPLYLQALSEVCASSSDWSRLDGARVAITGATGMIGAFLIDVLMKKRRDDGLAVSVIAIGRDEARARDRLPYFKAEGFSFLESNMAVSEAGPEVDVDVIFHLASETHPKAYSTRPIGTIESNVNGLRNVLAWACGRAGSPAEVVFASSVEVYGENRGDVERFAEDYCGYIDCNTLRAGYPEAKRLCEAMCQAWASERGINCFIPRLPRVFGPTVLPTDTKAVSQFISKAVKGEDIVLKSEGSQTYSYLYVADVVSGILYVHSRCESGVAYNLGSSGMDASLKQLATCLASIGNSKVVFEIPDAVERAGYSMATKALLDASRIERTGWKPATTMTLALENTVQIIRACYEI